MIRAMTESLVDPKAFLTHLFHTGLDAVRVETILTQSLPAAPKGKLFVLAIGKAAPAMAAVAQQVYGDAIIGLIATGYGHAKGLDTDLSAFEIIEAGHPIPDENSVAAAGKALEIAGDLREGDMMVVLISGGGSAHLCGPVSGLRLPEKTAVLSRLFAAGASIHEINCVRKQLSRVKGGRLAAAALPADIYTYAISDVVGDDIGFIASGPTVHNRESKQDAMGVLAKYNVDVPESVAKVLSSKAQVSPDLTPYLQHLKKSEVIASGDIALSAAEKWAMAHGIKVINIGAGVEGEASVVANKHAELAQGYVASHQPVLILSGGELTVKTDAKSGKGGANTEYVLALARALKGVENIWAIACDTDGKDGSGDNAGAAISPDTIVRASNLGMDARDYLARHDSYAYFAALGDLVITGPTQTNVNDFRAILVLPL